jgi:serine protease Do
LRFALFRQFFGGQNFRRNMPAQAGLGSGVIISADGYIVTNNHVVEGADIVKVSLDDKRELRATLVGRDPQTDIAVIKVDAKDLPFATFAESAKVEIGDRVLAIGNPFGIGETVTSGIVSAKSRRPGLGIAYEDFIQTDAAINPGNSGGALVDVDGRLIGINTAILSRSGGFQGVGLAVPSDLVRHVVENLVKNGKVVRGYLGVSVQNLTPTLAESFGLKQHSGAVIAEVKPNSPADKAGLRGGDVITSIDGKTITESADLTMNVVKMAPGNKVELGILRDDKNETIAVTVGKLPDPAKARKAQRFSANEDEESENEENSLSNSNPADESDIGVLNGVAVADLTPATRRELQIPSRLRGALITDVNPDSASARAGLKRGDVILEINRKPVRNSEDAVKMSEEASTKKTLLKLWSRGGTIYTVVDETE